MERFKVCRHRRHPSSVVCRLLSVPIKFPRKYISTSHQYFSLYVWQDNATGVTTMRHDDGDRQHDNGKGLNGEGWHDDGDGRHDDGKGHNGDGRHDDGNGQHNDGKGQQGDGQHNNGDERYDDAERQRQCVARRRQWATRRQAARQRQRTARRQVTQ
jgi:hypothetical protein